MSSSVDWRQCFLVQTLCTNSIAANRTNCLYYQNRAGLTIFRIWLIIINTRLQVINTSCIRDRPFNLKGGIMAFCFVQKFFVGQHELEYLFFLSRKARNFFPDFHIRLYDKNSESDYFFFPPPISEYFVQQHWESEYFFRKKTS